MKRQANRSVAGNIAVFLVLLLFGIFFLLPIVYAVVTAFKPMNEIFVFPPRMYVLKPTKQLRIPELYHGGFLGASVPLPVQ